MSGRTPSAALLAALGSEPAVRARFALAASAIARHGPAGARVARALRAAALGRLDAAERDWVERVERRRRELEARAVEIASGVEPTGGATPAWARGFDDEIPLWGATMMVSIPPVWGRFLLRLARELRPARALELGTAFGISTSFAAAGMELAGGGRILAIDAARGWAAVAAEGFAELGLAERVELRVGHLDETLAAALADVAGEVDLAFIDAEHEGPATVRHFEAIAPRLAPGGVVLFDDVWSPREMREAWRAIRRHERVAASVGLGRMGLAIAG